jgi:hypothetical protein
MNVSENQDAFRRSMQGILGVAGRPVEILSLRESSEREGWIDVEVRCQNEPLTLSLRVDKAGSVENLDIHLVAKTTLPITGLAVPQMTSFDAMVIDLMKRWSLVGASLAVAKDGRLVFARGHGFSDLERQVPVQPDSLFRIASVSKPITSAAVLSLVEHGRLDLNARAFELLESLKPPRGAAVDPRLATITVRQLLWHAGGWDRDRSFDPMFSGVSIGGNRGGSPCPRDSVPAGSEQRYARVDAGQSRSSKSQDPLDPDDSIARPGMSAKPVRILLCPSIRAA